MTDESAPPPSAAGRDGMRNGGIDLLRAVFVLAVMAFHYTVRWIPPDYPLNLPAYTDDHARAWSIGAYGVHLFFVISGYVITLSVLRARSAWRFAVGRFLRIYPAFLIAALLAFAVLLVLGPAFVHPAPADLAATLVLIPTELGRAYVDGAFWTLTVEVKFYGFVALGYMLLGRRFWMLIVVVATLGMILDSPAPGLADRVLLSRYIAFFLFGMAIRYLLDRRERVAGVVLALTGIVAYVLHAGLIGYDGGVSPVLHVLLIGGTGLIFLLARDNPRLRLPPLTYLGAISYEIYLVHQMIGLVVIRLVKQATGWPDWSCALVGAAESIALASLLHHVLAPPLRSLMGRALAGPARRRPREILPHR